MPKSAKKSIFGVFRVFPVGMGGSPFTSTPDSWAIPRTDHFLALFGGSGFPSGGQKSGFFQKMALFHDFGPPVGTICALEGGFWPKTRKIGINSKIYIYSILTNLFALCLLLSS